MTLSVITWAVAADFDRDDVYEYDLTTAIDADGGAVRVKRGVGADGSPQASTIALDLKNDLGTFTPEYSASALYGKLRPDVPIKITATHNAVAYTLWTGYATRWRPDFAQSGWRNRCRLAASDLLGAFLAVSAGVNVTVSNSRNTNGAIQAVLGAVGLTSSDWNLDAGQQSLPWHFARNQKATDALMDAVRSEMGGQLFVTADGKVRFEDRANRLGVTPDDTWGDGTSVTPSYITYDLDDSDLVTSVEVVATVFTLGQDQTEILRFRQGYTTRPTPDSLAFAAGETKTFSMDYAVPVYALTTPVAHADYAGNSAVDASGTDKTSALTVTVTDLGGGATIQIKNTDAGTVYLTYFRLRGSYVAFANQKPRFVASKSVPGAKLDRGVNISVPFADNTTVLPRDYSVQTLRTFRYPYPRVTLEFEWDSDAIAVAMLGVELGDLILFKDPTSGVWGTGVNDWFYVESIEHEFGPVRIGRSQIELVPSYLWRNLAAIEYDNFTRANASGLGTTISDATWANSSGFSIVSNKARPNSTSLQAANLPVGGSGNMVVEVSLSNMNSDTDEECGVVYRYTDASNYWRAYVDDGSNEIILEKNVAGVVTSLANAAWTPTATAELRAMAQGSRHRVWVDGILYVDVTDSALNTATRAGLFSRSTTTVDYDDFYAQAL